MSFRLLATVSLLVLLPVVTVQAQGRRGGPGGPGGFGGPGGPGGGMRMSPTMLLGQESVQKELQLSPEQVKTLQAISDQQRNAMAQTFQLDREERGARMQEISKQTEAAVAQVLSPPQQQRLTQIALQQQGTRAFDRPEVVQGLGLTAEQLAQIQQIQQAANDEMNELLRKQMEEIRKSAEKKVMATVLKPEQAAQWQEARGPVFEGEIVFNRFGGPRETSPGEQAAREANRTTTEAPKSPTDDKYKAVEPTPSTSAPKAATTKPTAKKPAATPPTAKKPATTAAPKKTTPPATKKAPAATESDTP